MKLATEGESISRIRKTARACERAPVTRAQPEAVVNLFLHTPHFRHTHYKLGISEGHGGLLPAIGLWWVLEGAAGARDKGTVIQALKRPLERADLPLGTA